MISFKISAELTKPEEEEKSEILKERPFQVIIGDQESNTTNWPFDAFQDELIGLSEKDTKSIVHKFKEETPYEMFKEKEITFNVSIESIKAMELPELDADFIKSFGDYDSLTDFERAIRKNLEESQAQEYDQKYISEIIDEIVEGSTIKYSPNILEDEIKSVLTSLEQDLARQNLDIETYIKTKDTDRDSYIEEEIKPVAIKRLKRSLVLEKIAQTEKIELDEVQLQTGVSTVMEQLYMTPGFQKPKSTQDMRTLTNMVSFDTANRLINEQVLKRLKDIACGKLDEVEAEPEVEADDVVEQEISSSEPTSEESDSREINEQVAAEEEKTEVIEDVPPDMEEVEISQDEDKEPPGKTISDEV
ncbi:MAG: hypothetical protein MUO76_23145 [Anaerolineaceae bacterium]|nr:hypothetical protein [Anaerolineaceae bacterium]